MENIFTICGFKGYLKLKELKKTVKNRLEKSNFSVNKLFIF